MLIKIYDRKWFEPRGISSSYCVIVQAKVVLKSTVVGEWGFDNLSGSHLQSQVNSIGSVNDAINSVRWTWLVSLAMMVLAERLV